MFEAKLADASTFRKIIESLKEIIKEGNFECSEPGITFQGVDSSFIALVQLTLRRQGFSSYDVDETLNLGINIENILKVLKCGGPKDSLTLSAQDDSDTLSLTFESDNRVSKFDHRLMVIDSEQLSFPQIGYTTQCHMPSQEFARIVRDLSTLGETVEITLNSDSICFTVESPTGSGSITLSQNDSDNNGNQIKLKVEEEITQRFPLRYLNNFAKAAPLSEHVTLKLSANSPFCVDYRMMVPSEEKDADKVALGALRFFLAPKMDDDGEEAADE